MKLSTLLKAKLVLEIQYQIKIKYYIFGYKYNLGMAETTYTIIDT